MFRCVVNRVSKADVVINGKSQGVLGHGLLVLFGVGSEAGASLSDNTFPTVGVGLEKLADKICGLRIFADAQGKMNLSVLNAEGGIYVVSQFTLFADCKKGMRPSFTGAAPPAVARTHSHNFLQMIRLRMGVLQVFSGEFGADMKLEFVNDGPVTLILNANAEGVQ